MNAETALILAFVFGAPNPPPQPAVLQYATVTKADVAKTATTRAPIGHTHTCANGHTWDHAANPTHTCQFCGLNQFVVDTRPRAVTVTAAPIVKQSLPVRAVSYDHEWDYKTPPLLQSLYSSVSAGGCANGQCATPSRGRGFFR
jgi:hypothetical protein